MRRGAAALALAAATAVADVVVPSGASWRYLRGTAAPPTNWAAADFADGAWEGPAPGPFGTGDSDDATNLADLPGGYLAVFTRTTFVVSPTSRPSRVTLSMDYDDGFVAYLNGQEIARGNIAANPAGYDAPADGHHEASRTGDEYDSHDREFFAVDPALLVVGTNVLAVSGHNVELGDGDLTLDAALYAGVNLLRGPFVQRPDPGAMTVCWRTDAAVDGVVEHGPDATCGAGVVTDPVPRRDHAVRLEGLPPGTTWWYRVRSAGALLAGPVALRTPPAPEAPFRIAIVGDMGYKGIGLTGVAARVAAEQPDLILTVGDNIYMNGQPGDYDPLLFQPYAAALAGAPMFPALGNHDTYYGNARWMASFFALPTNGPPGMSELAYSFDYGNAHVVMFDSNPFRNLDAAGMATLTNWLDADLGGTTQRWKLVCYHHPPYTSPSVHDEDANMKARVAPILARRGVQLAFQGHNHFYERINPVDGVRYLTDGGGGFTLYNVYSPRTYSAARFHTDYSYVIADVAGGTLSLRAMSRTGAQVDRDLVDLDHPFRMDGLLDSSAWGRVTNGLALHAAIRGRHLYLATQDAGEGNDHFLCLASSTGSLRAANWAKAGQVMQWDAFLADENDNGASGWHDATEGRLTNDALCRAVTSGLNNNGAAANGVLEGTIDLFGLYGSFPTQVLVAAAPFASANGGALVAASQAPAGNGNGSVEAAEFLALPTRALALDAATAVTPTALVVETGWPVILDGSASLGPRDLPMSFVWERLSGPEGTFSGTGSAVAVFMPTNAVPPPATIVFRLRVVEPRFFDEAQVVVTVLAFADTDGDGLSDAEELSGRNSAHTPLDPAGRTSNPALADTDGDGLTDGEEAVAGSDPADPASHFRLSSAGAIPPAVRIVWSGVTGRTYRVYAASDAKPEAWSLQAEVPAAVPWTAWTQAMEGLPPTRWYRVDVR